MGCKSAQGYHAITGVGTTRAYGEQMDGFLRPLAPDPLFLLPQESPYLHTLRNSQLLQDRSEADPSVLSWAMPVAAGGGLVLGVGTMMVWRAVRGRQQETPPMSLNTMSF